MRKALYERAEEPAEGKLRKNKRGLKILVLTIVGRLRMDARGNDKSRVLDGQREH